ncbi:hypothetical protein AGMMS49942_09020 [Spirochaetia bacterium]|nr:hypothetical protein AGMMS49942_09020 [Spirochaetia bacterium]
MIPDKVSEVGYLIPRSIWLIKVIEMSAFSARAAWCGYAKGQGVLIQADDDKGAYMGGTNFPQPSGQTGQIGCQYQT